MRLLNIRSIVATALLAAVIATPAAKADTPATQTTASSIASWLHIFGVRPDQPQG